MWLGFNRVPFSVSVLGLFAAQALTADPVISAGITFEEFKNAFDSENRVWYAQLQAGSNGTTGADTHEFEFGGSGGTFSENEPYYISDVPLVWDETWFPGTINPFSVAVDAANNLSVTAAGVSTPSDNEYPITEPFNEIWIGLRLATDDRDDLSVNSHQYDGRDINDMSVNGATGTFAAFKLHDDQEIDNIAEFIIEGNLLVDTFIGRPKEEWTYTVFGIYNSDVEPPSVTIPVKITGFDYDRTSDTLVFAWDSNESATYSIHYTDDLSLPFDDLLEDGILSEGASTSHGPVPSPSPGSKQLFFQLTETLP